MDVTPERSSLVEGMQAGSPPLQSPLVSPLPHQKQPDATLLAGRGTTPRHRRGHQGHVRHVTQDISLDGDSHDDEESDSFEFSLRPADFLSRHTGHPALLSGHALRHGQYQHTRRAPYQPTPGDIYTRLLLPGTRVSIVIGRGGDAIRSICDITGAHVNIASPGANHRDPAHRLVTVMGSVMAVCWAVDLLAQKAGLFEGYSNINPQHRSRKRANVPLCAPTPSTCFNENEAPSPTNAATMSNTGCTDEQGIASALSAHTLPQGELLLFPPGVKMVIDSSKAGLVIGKAGVTITDIRMQSRARILLLDEGQSAKEGAIERERVLIIIGMPDYCRRAHQLVISALSARPLMPEDSRHLYQERQQYPNGPRALQPPHQQPSYAFNDGHHYPHQQAASALYSSMAYAPPRYSSSDHLAMSLLSESMAHLGMTNGYYSLSPYAAMSLFPHNPPSPQVYLSAGMRTFEELQHPQQHEQIQEHQLESPEDMKPAVQGAPASIPGTEEENAHEDFNRAEDTEVHTTVINSGGEGVSKAVSEDTQAHGS